MLSIILLSLSVTTAKAECIKTDKIPYLVVKADKSHYIKLLEGEEILCEKLASDFNSNKARRVCGCQHIDYQNEQDTVRLRCAEVENNKLYSRTTATYYYYPEAVPACIRFRDLLNYEIR